MKSGRNGNRQLGLMQKQQAQAPQKGRREQSKQQEPDKQKPGMHKTKHKTEAPEPLDSGEAGTEGKRPRSRLRIIPPAAAAGQETVTEDPTELQGRR